MVLVTQIILISFLVSQFLCQLINDPRNRSKVILIGDSLTEYSCSVELNGWGIGLMEWYTRSFDVLNRGFSDYTSRLLKLMSY